MSNGGDLRAWGTTLLRVVIGVVFFMHGGQKLFMGFHNVAGFFGSLGIPFPTTSAIVVTAAELLGGGALVLGVCTRYVAAILAIDIGVALVTYHLKNGFFAPGVEFPMVLLAANLSLVLSGGGALALFRS